MKAFNSSGEASGLDPANLADGVFTVYVDMYNAANPSQKSMSDGTVTKPVTLTVKAEKVRNELNEAVAAAKDISNAGGTYTEASFEALTEDISAAELLLKDGSAAAAQLAAALSDLQAAQSGLVKAAVKVSIAKAAVTLKKTSMAYTGKALKPGVKAVKVGGKTLKAGTRTVTVKVIVK